MHNQRLITTLSPEIKLNKIFYLFDISVIGGVFVLLMSTHQYFRHIALKIAYIVVVLIIAIWSIIKPANNPFKRNYELVLMAFKTDTETYHTVFPDSLAYYKNSDNYFDTMFDTTAESEER